MDWLEILTLENEEVVFIWDPAQFLCGRECNQFSGGKPLFRDTNHLSYFGANALGDNFVAFLERAYLAATVQVE